MFKIFALVGLWTTLQATELGQTYYIKGMTCGMCVKSIKSSLEKTPEVSLADSVIEVGTANLKFKNQDKDINCKVVRAIEGSTDYKVFLDKEYLKPACPKS